MKATTANKSVVDSDTSSCTMPQGADMSPGQFSRRILLAVTGMTPQVVTETIYALAVEAKQKFVPTEIHVITTVKGEAQIRLLLLDPSSGKFHALCREFDLPPIDFPVTNIHVIPDVDGQPLDDIRTPMDNLRSADYISHVVKEFCLDEDAALHVSIAGGRKSMGFFAGYALSLFGRAQDSLSHVLVNEPFESLKDFYYPPKLGCVLIGNDKNKSPVHTDDARVMLADIPFVRLRGGLPSSLMTGDMSFAETVIGVQSGLNFVSLEFDVKKHAICCGGKWIVLEPAKFAFYLWLAKRCVARLPENGAICRLAQENDNEYLSIYAKVVGNMSAHFESIETSLQKCSLDSAFYEQNKNYLNEIIKKNLPLDYRKYKIESSGRKPNRKDALRLLPEHITLPKGIY